MKCKRCSYIWLPCGTREIPKTGNLYMVDLGLCHKCNHAVSRVKVATPGEQLSAHMKFDPIFKLVEGDSQ